MATRIRYYWTAVFFSRIVPILLVLFKYEIFKPETSWVDRITITGLAIIGIMAYAFFKDLVKFIQSLGNGRGARVVKYLKAPFAFLIACFGVVWVKYGVQNLVFVLSWSCASNVIAIYFWVKHDELVGGNVTNE